MNFIKTLINKYNHKKIIRDYLKAFPPYEVHPSIGIDLRANQMAKKAKKEIRQTGKISNSEV